MPKRKHAPKKRPAFIARSDKRAKQVYLSPADFATITEAAAAAGESVSAYLAKAGLDRAAKVMAARNHS